MRNIVDEYKRIKENYSSREDSFSWWANNSGRSELGIASINSKTRKISLRSSDENESTVIYQNLVYIDFGESGRTKDPVDRIMQTMNCSFIEAVRIFVSWEGSEIQNFTPSEHKKKDSSDKLNISIIRECILNKDRYRDRYNAVKAGLFRSCSESEIIRGEKLLSIGFSPISQYEKEDRVFIPEFDETSTPWGFYKYNRGSAFVKGLLRSNSKRVIFGSHLIKWFPKDIIYVEGHTDAVVNISKGYAAITTGSATKLFGDNIENISGKTLHDFPDLDIPGMIGAMKRGLEIDEFNLTNPDKKITHIIYWWSEWMKSDKIYDKISKNMVEEYELYFHIKNQIPLKNNVANLNMQIFDVIAKIFADKNGIELSDRLLPSKWKIMQKGAEKSGFDWIDFHEKGHEGIKKEKFDNFMLKFKFR